MKKIKLSPKKNNYKNKSINFSKILNSDLFFQSSGMIKMALNKNRLLDRDFGVKRAKAKIDIGKKNKIKISPEGKQKIKKSKEEEQTDNTYFRKREIPFELADIIENNQIKFEKVFDSFHNIKNKNDLFAAHWQYVQQSIQKNKNKGKQINFNDVKKEQLLKNIKNYDFSKRDKIELELEKKLTEKIFKSNPLMIKNNTDMLFYFLSIYKDKNINFQEQNTTKYLNKVKDILDYMEVLLDYKTDQMNEDIEAQNNKFLMKRKEKIDEENLKQNQEQEKQNIIDNIESKKMIHKTKWSIKLLNKNKKYFEDPNYFSKNYDLSSTFYKNNTSKFLTPNKKSIIINKSSSNFFVGDKNHFNKFNNSALNYLQEKKNNISKKLSSLMEKDRNAEQKKEQKIEAKKFFQEKNIKNNSYNNLNSLNKQLNKNSNSKEKPLKCHSRNINKLTKLKIFHKSNSLNINSKELIKNKFISDNNNLPIIKISPHGPSFSGDLRGSLPINSNFSKIFSQKDKDNSSNMPTSKNNNDSNRTSFRKSINNDSFNDKKKGKLSKTVGKKKQKSKKNIQKVVISDLYDKLKDGKNLNKNNLRHIYKYINQKNLGKKNQKDTMNLIKDVQLLSDGFDINKVTKSIDNIPYKEIKQIKQIKNFKIINNELNRLYKRYVKEICEFKARNQRNEGQNEY